MFSVKFLGHGLPNKIPILSGVTFGFFDQPINFEIISEQIQTPYLVDFIVSKDKSKKPFELAFKNLAQDKLQIDFYNPSQSGASGLTAPVGILTLENKYILGFMFMVDVVGDSPGYRMTYEFYDGVATTSTEKVK
ncbi:MAG TPA: hypothetical protein VGM58_06715 [Verrucomicrobiae bacterium]|jgi:hypothetical protein